MKEREATLYIRQQCLYSFEDALKIQDGKSPDWGIKSDTNGNPIRWFGHNF